MNDLEICRRIAEIECDTWYYSIKKNKRIMMLQGKASTLNPLTDDALCFQLMVKYDVDLTSPYRIEGETEWEAQLLREGTDYFVRVYNENPNKAICLVIIEAHEEAA